MLFNDITNSKIQGHLRVYEEETGNLLLDHHNAIHPENFSLAISNSLANNGGIIKELAFGSGGVRVNASNEFLYSSPQTIGRTAGLYNETYKKVLDQHNQENTDPTRNYMSVSHATGNVYTDILCHCTLEKNEPEGQNVISNSSEIITEYTFNEVGLRTVDGDLITHLCFYPISKNSNITLIFDYLIRIQIV